jgi:hypothetical protein
LKMPDSVAELRERARRWRNLADQFVAQPNSRRDDLLEHAAEQDARADELEEAERSQVAADPPDIFVQHANMVRAEAAPAIRKRGARREGQRGGQRSK